MADTSELQQEAETLGLTMLPTPNGFAFAPVSDGKVMEQTDVVFCPGRRNFSVFVRTEDLFRSEEVTVAPLVEAEDATHRRKLVGDGPGELVEALARGWASVGHASTNAAIAAIASSAPAIAQRQRPPSHIRRSGAMNRSNSAMRS